MNIAQSFAGAVQEFFAAHAWFAFALLSVLFVTIVVVILGVRPVGRDDAATVTRLRQADPEIKRRIWDHGMHEDVIFNDRLNFFLVFESVLLAAVGSAYSNSGIDLRVLRFVAIFGIAVTLLWLYVQVRHWYITKSLKTRFKAIFDDYASAVQLRRWWPLHTYGLLAYCFPLLVVLAWLVLLGFLEGWHLGL